MYRATFDIISRFITRKNKCQIVFDLEKGGSSDMENGVVHLPKNISDKNAFGVLALLMHESGHIAYSKPAYDQLDKSDRFGMDIFNCVEDVRIDLKNFDELPNIKSFHVKMIEDECNYSQNVDNKISKVTKILVNAIMMLEGVSQYGFPDADVYQFLSSTPLLDYMSKAKSCIDHGDWKEMKKWIEEIKKLLSKEDPKAERSAAKAIALMKPGCEGSESDKPLEPLPSGEAYLDEQTVTSFKELLNISERKVVQNGAEIDTDNLTAFFTGDLDGLLKDEVVVQKKRSKISFLLDASGSMEEWLLDEQSRILVVKKCTQRIIRILKEVKEQEGINIDWDVYLFRHKSWKPLDWEQEYRADGGTFLERAFNTVLTEMSRDNFIDGNKIVVVMTDGEVGEDQIDKIRKDLFTYGGDIKVVIIGVGCELEGKFVEKIIGNNIIVSEESANQVILEAIKQLL